MRNNRSFGYSLNKGALGHYGVGTMTELGFYLKKITGREQRESNVDIECRTHACPRSVSLLGESLGDIEACLRSQTEKLYHMGIRGQVSRNTLANANATRDWRIYADFAQRLIGIARKLYINEPFGVDLANTAYASDSTTIDLRSRCFRGRRFASRKPL